MLPASDGPRVLSLLIEPGLLLTPPAGVPDVGRCTPSGVPTSWAVVCASRVLCLPAAAVGVVQRSFMVLSMAWPVARSPLWWMPTSCCGSLG